MLLNRDGTEFEIASTSRLQERQSDIRGFRFPVEGSLSGIAVRTDAPCAAATRRPTAVRFSARCRRRPTFAAC